MYLEEFTICGSGRGRGWTYPFDEWFSSGKVVRIEKDVDFGSTVNSMRVYIYTKAKAKGYKIESRVSGNVIEFMATKIEEVQK